MPKIVDDEGKPIEMSLEALLKAFPGLGTEASALWQKRLDDRFKNSPDPDKFKALQAERDTLAKKAEELANANKTELQLQIDRANKLDAALKVAEQEKTKIASESEAKYRRRIVRERISAYAADNKVPGAKHFTDAAAGLFKIADDEEPFAEDTATGKRLSLKERLDAFRREPGNEIFNPPLVHGSDQRPGAPAPAPTVGDWHKDPALRAELAKRELRDLPVTGGLVQPTTAVDAGLVNTDGSRVR